jgi:hypothetical protein
MRLTLLTIAALSMCAVADAHVRIAPAESKADTTEKAGDKIVWKVHQRYADGTSSEWTGPAGSRGPAPVTKLLPSER